MKNFQISLENLQVSLENFQVFWKTYKFLRKTCKFIWETYSFSGELWRIAQRHARSSCLADGKANPEIIFADSVPCTPIKPDELCEEFKDATSEDFIFVTKVLTKRRPS
jgi:hypothetical protein